MPDGDKPVPLWGRFEATFQSTVTYENPLQEVALTLTLTGPSGQTAVVDSFWDGGNTWRVRFSPQEQGEWKYVGRCNDPSNRGLQTFGGHFVCGPPGDIEPFGTHGPITVSENRHHLSHMDGTPFFFLADTVWNGPLLSDEEEWAEYLETRRTQGFSAIQFVATQWLASPDGDRESQVAFSGTECIEINPAFFQRLDKKIDQVNEHGLLAVPVMLWENSIGTTDPSSNPGHVLPESQAILLGRYMVARWGANALLWILMGDWRYLPANAGRWRRIGAGIFSQRSHAPVATHVRSKVNLAAEFRNEDWLDVVGYQSGHGVDDASLRSIAAGEVSKNWAAEPIRPYMNLEPNYEAHPSHSGVTISAADVRRACYWSLLNAPTAGVTYGADGLWWWSDGATPALGHGETRAAPHWRELLSLPGGRQMSQITSIFGSVKWWRLRPAPTLLAEQPGEIHAPWYVMVSADNSRNLILAYTPESGTIMLNPDELNPDVSASWINPRDGECIPAFRIEDQGIWRYTTPQAGDWVLVLTTEN